MKINTLWNSFMRIVHYYPLVFGVALFLNACGEGSSSQALDSSSSQSSASSVFFQSSVPSVPSVSSVSSVSSSSSQSSESPQINSFSLPGKLDSTPEDSDVDSQLVINELVAHQNYVISGVFSPFDFVNVIDAFDWIYKDYSSGDLWQLHASDINDSIFGWKEVNISEPKIDAWYMIYLNVDDNNNIDYSQVSDEKTRFDWVLFYNNEKNTSIQLSYKLSGFMEDGTFKYSSPLDINYSISDNKIHIIIKDTNKKVQYPYPQHKIYSSEFIKPSNYTQFQMDQHVSDFYKKWKDDFVITVPQKDLSHYYRIALGKKSSKYASMTVSEGQGYGMIITALMAGYDEDAQEIFDGMFAFVKKYPSKFYDGLMSWKVDLDDFHIDDSAFDGDADIAYALLLAHKQWGSEGTVNYFNEAKKMVESIYVETIGADSKLPMLGDWVNPNAKVYNQYTNRSSDLMLSNFFVFKEQLQENRWDEVIAASINAIVQIQDEYASKTFLLPDFFLSTNGKFKPVKANFLEDKYDGDYYYNACRIPFRLGAYTLLHGNSILSERLKKLSIWIESKSNSNVNKIYAGYKLSGKVLNGSRFYTSLFVSTFAIAAMHNPQQQEWLNSIYASVYDKHEDYFEDSVTLLSLLLISGNYWD